MAKLFNVVSAGRLSEKSTLSRPLSTNEANSDIGRQSFLVDIPISLPNSIISEGLPIKGIFLHIGKVHRNATSLLSISFTTSTDTYNNVYYTSALYREPLQVNTLMSSQYWQGFDVGEINIPANDTFVVSVSCSSLTDLEIVGDNTKGFNRYIIPVSASDTILNDLSASVCIGSYISSINVSLPTDFTSITADVDFACEDINVWSNSTFICSTINVQVSGNIVAAADGIFTLMPGATALLFNDAKIISVDTSTISAIGTYKQPYTYLDADVVSSEYQFTSNSLTSWETGDLLYFPGNTAADSSETLSITSILNRVVDINGSFNFNHYSINNTNFNMFGGVFLGAPVCNLTRNTLISAQELNSSIIADNSSRIILNNICIKNLSHTAGGAINLSNTTSVITGCVISGNTNGIAVDVDYAKNYLINNNTIYSCANGVNIVGAPAFTAPNVNTISNNIIAKSTNNGINTEYLNNIKYNDNIIVDSDGNGIQASNPTDQNLNIYQLSGNCCYNNYSAGILLEDCAGTIHDNTAIYNDQGIVWSNSSVNRKINIQLANAAYNKTTGINLYNGEVSANNLNSYNNRTGILYNNIYGASTSNSVTGCKLYGISVYNCNIEEFEIKNINVNNNIINLQYDYPSQSGWNFYPTYLTNCVIGSANDTTCIVLKDTKCEKFVVTNAKFCSTGPNVTLTPATDSIIEGSYLFYGCLFTIPFDDVFTKYQANALHETGFAIMYENNTKQHSKTTSAGTVQTDNIVYHNLINETSEKLTPRSADIPLFSSKKLVLLDNFDGSIPPNLISEYLYAHVWVKKDSSWGSNSSPALMVAANPTLSIFEDTIIDTHTIDTTDWVQLSSTAPIASAVNVRGVVELFVSCQGNSGGSINIDDWHITIV